MLHPPNRPNPYPTGATPRPRLVLPFAEPARGRSPVLLGSGLALLITPVHRLADSTLCGGDVAPGPARIPDPAALLHAACQEAARWQGGPPWGAGMRLFVSLSGEALHGGKLDRQLALALQASSLTPDLLEVAFAQDDLECDSPELGLRLSALRDLGAGVALDTAGIGSNLLRLLRRLPITAVRLAPALVGALEACNTARTAALDTICLAHASGAAAVALGVSNACQRDILADMQCDEAQGPAFAMAMGAEAFAGVLSADDKEAALC